MEFYVYIIRSLKSGMFYTGSSADINKRFKEHSEGRNKFTKNKGPFKIMLIERFKTRSEALRREKYFKTGKGREERDRLICEQGSAASATAA